MLSAREEKQKIVRDKLKCLYKAHNKYLILEDKLNVMNKIINRNQKNETVSVKQLDFNGKIVNLQNLVTETSQKPQKRRSNTQQCAHNQQYSQRRNLANSEESTLKISFPFHFYNMKSTGVTMEKGKTFDGKVQLAIQSKSPLSPFLFEDFEIVKKLI